MRRAPVEEERPPCPCCHQRLVRERDEAGALVLRCASGCALQDENPEEVRTLSLVCPCGDKLIVAKAVTPDDWWPFKFEAARAREWFRSHANCWKAIA